MIGGRVALLLHPRCLQDLARQRQVVLVSGTNGKTTTTAMLVAALSIRGPVASNATGANMLDGLTTTLADQPTGPVVGEVDELYVPEAVRQTQPAVVVLLNLTRDQLDRVGELRQTAAQLHRLAPDVPGVMLVANCDDPYVVFVACVFRHVVWVSAGASGASEAGSCPHCGHQLTVGHAARAWHCGRCGLHRPSPHWRADSPGVMTPEGTSLALRLRLPGAVNRSNAAMAVVASAALGIPPPQAADAVSSVDGAAGRYRTVRHGSHEVQLLLAKNPAGWTAMLDVLCTHPHPVVIAINAREADGCDTSWLYDVAFDRLAHHRVLASGQRAADLAMRLSYAAVAHTTIADPLQALEQLPPGPVLLVGDYTSFLDLSRRLDNADEPQRNDPYWTTTTGPIGHLR